MNPNQPRPKATSPLKKTSPSRSKSFSAVGTDSYVDALDKQDHPEGKKTSKKSSASKLATMRSGKWLNPPLKIKDYLAYDSGIV